MHIDNNSREAPGARLDSGGKSFPSPSGLRRKMIDSWVPELSFRNNLNNYASPLNGQKSAGFWVTGDEKQVLYKKPSAAKTAHPLRHQEQNFTPVSSYLEGRAGFHSRKVLFLFGGIFKALVAWNCYHATKLQHGKYS